MADWDEAIKEAYAAAPADQVLLSTIEIYHETMVAPVRMVADNGVWQENIDGLDIYGHLMTLEDSAPLNPSEEVLFQSVMFSFQLATQSDARISGLEVTIDNATNLISGYLDEAVTVRSPMTLIYREYLSTDLTTPHLIIRNLTIPKISSSVLQVSATAEFRDLINKKFPNLTYQPADYRGLTS